MTDEAESGVGACELRLHLFVSGATPASLRAISTVRDLCEQRFADRYRFEVTDVYRKPETAHKYQLVALPALLKLAPDPKRLFVGDMRDVHPLVAELDAVSMSRG